MKKIQKKWGDTIYLEWRDANGESGWVDYKEAMTVTDNQNLCKTNAFFIGQTSGFVIIAHTVGLNKDEDVLGVERIPDAWIIKWK